MLKYCVACSVLLACAALSQTRKIEKNNPPSVLEGDQRLAKKLRVQTDVIPLAQVVPKVHEQLGVDIMVQGDMLRRTVSLQQADRPAKELLADLGLMLGGTWVRRGDAYLLLTDDVTAGLVKRWNGRQATAESQALVLSLTPGQQRMLVDGNNVKFGTMLPEQKRLVRVIATEAFLENPQRYPSSVVTGEGFMIAKPKVSDPPCLTFLAPVVWDDGRLTVASMGEVVLQDLKR